jgi:hypothetical protein
MDRTELQIGLAKLAVTADHGVAKSDPLGLCPVQLDALRASSCGNSHRGPNSPYDSISITRRSSTNEAWQQPAIGYRLQFNQKSITRPISGKTGAVIHYTLPNGTEVDLTPTNAKATWCWHGNIDVKPGTLIEFFAYTKYRSDAPLSGSEGLLECFAR